MVLNTAKKQVEGVNARGDLQGTVDQNFPSSDPDWARISRDPEEC